MTLHESVEYFWGEPLSSPIIDDGYIESRESEYGISFLYAFVWGVMSPYFNSGTVRLADSVVQYYYARVDDFLLNDSWLPDLLPVSYTHLTLPTKRIV